MKPKRVLREEIVRLIPEKDRKSLGVETTEEALSRGRKRQEQEEQRLFSSWLRQLEAFDELTWNMPASHVKSTIRSGWPDFVIHRAGMTLYIEMKSDKGSLTKEQKEFKRRLECQRIQHEICRSFEEAREAVKRILF